MYTHPTTGIAFEYVGACETATCSGTYYDNGGAGANYSNNINGVYRIFCPNTAGQCLTATFTQFSIEGGGGCPFDLFRVSNGSTQNSPLLFSGCGTGAIGPFTGTANGCLGFRFWSDFSVTLPGWTATFSCSPCAGGPSGTANNDCVNATQVCSNVNVPGNSTGPGIAAEACGGAACPAGGENYSNWYLVTIATSGTFNFTITPSIATDDYDYAVYGPNVTCGALGANIRCSDAGATGNTGLSALAIDNSENVTGDKFTAEMNVTAGQWYYIMVDEWTPTGAGYTLSFGGTATISCTPLPLELLSFYAGYNYSEKAVELQWETASETNMEKFTVEYSTDGGAFEPIGVIPANNGNHNNLYQFTHSDPMMEEINYYRIAQTDREGRTVYSDIRAVMINDPQGEISVFPSPATEQTQIEFHTAYDEIPSEMNIYDYSGKHILTYNFTAKRGKNVIPLELFGFDSGVHFVTIQCNGTWHRTAFVKQ